MRRLGREISPSKALDLESGCWGFKPLSEISTSQTYQAFNLPPLVEKVAFRGKKGPKFQRHAVLQLMC